MPLEAMPQTPLPHGALSYTIKNTSDTARTEILLKGAAFTIKKKLGKKDNRRLWEQEHPEATLEQAWLHFGLLDKD